MHSQEQAVLEVEPAGTEPEEALSLELVQQIKVLPEVMVRPQQTLSPVVEEELGQ
jgi:hypothetical protein